MDFMKNPVIDAAVEMLKEAVALIHSRFPHDLEEQVVSGAEAAFSEMNLSGALITAEKILAHYQHHRTPQSAFQERHGATLDRMAVEYRRNLVGRLVKLHTHLKGEAFCDSDWRLARTLEDRIGAEQVAPNDFAKAEELLSRYGF